MDIYSTTKSGGMLRGSICNALPNERLNTCFSEIMAMKIIQDVESHNALMFHEPNFEEVTQKSHVSTLQNIIHPFEPGVAYSSICLARIANWKNSIERTNVDDSTLIIQFNSLMAFTQSIESHRHVPDTYPMYLRWLNARRSASAYSAGNWRIECCCCCCKPLCALPATNILKCVRAALDYILFFFIIHDYSFMWAPSAFNAVRIVSFQRAIKTLKSDCAWCFSSFRHPPNTIMRRTDNDDWPYLYGPIFCSSTCGIKTTAKPLHWWHYCTMNHVTKFDSQIEFESTPFTQYGSME